MVFDYHSHIGWDQLTNTYDVSSLILDMKTNGIDRRLVSALAGSNIREQNEFIENLVKDHPNQLDGCAVINPKMPNCIEEAERISRNSRFKAIELDSLEHNYFPEEQKKTLDTIFEIASDCQIVVNVFTGWGCRTMPAQWAFYARRHPKIQMVFLHMGTTDFGYGLIDLVPQYDNLFIETSCMYELPILRKAFSKIDVDQILFGSHFPHKFTSCSLHTFDLLKLPQETKNKMFYKNYNNILQLNGAI